jgi:hypothetical protein
MKTNVTLAWLDFLVDFWVPRWILKKFVPVLELEFLKILNFFCAFALLCCGDFKNYFLNK